MKPHRYSDDAPKTDPDSEDTLGYAPFAALVARFIHRQPAPNGYVIGLHGPWGSGKSTALNFIKARLDELSAGEAQRLRIVDFRPWIISGHQDLVSGYFKVLQEAMQPGSALRTRRTKGGVRLVRSSLDPLANAVGALGAALDPLSGAALKATVTAAGKGAGAALDQWLTEPSLQAAYDQLSRQLAAGNRRFLVLIDDLDRLDASEIRTLVQMVKSVGRLPNVIYLLAYDREIVWDALGEPAGSRPDFMEKIVQQELELPPPTRDRLMGMLSAETAFAIEAAPHDMRWHYIVNCGIFRWIRSPRDVARLANAMKFAWTGLDGEVDAHDLLAMEAMRLYDNAVFAWVRDHRDVLLGSTGRYVSEAEAAAAIRELHDGLPTATRDDQLKVLASLFPSRAKEILGERSMGGWQPYYEVANRGGVQSPAGYDTYFALHPSPNAVRKAFLRSTMDRLDDEAFQTAQLDAMLPASRESGGPLIADYLWELNSRFVSEAGPVPTQSLMNALFARSDRMLRIDQATADFQRNPHVQLVLLIDQMLDRVGPTAAGALLLNAARAHPSPTLLADIWVAQAEAYGRLPLESQRTRRQPRIDEASLDVLGAELVEEIDALREGPLMNPPSHIYALVTAWAHLASPEAPQAWLAAGAHGDPNFLVAVARAHLATSGPVGARQFSYSSRDEPLMAPADLLAAAERHLDADFRGPEDRARVAALIEGLRAQPEA